ncbi:unnamed protein product [Brassica rapa subsp. trilocularis]
MKKEIHFLLIITMSIEKMAMQRIEKEFKDVTWKDSLYIISRDSNDLFKWNAMIQGPYGSPYAGGIIQLSILKDQYALTFLKTTGTRLSQLKRCMTYLPRSRRRFRSPALRRSVGLMILPLLLWFSVSFSPYRLVYVNLDFATATVTLDVSVSPALSLIVTISPVPTLCIMIALLSLVISGGHYPLLKRNPKSESPSVMQIALIPRLYHS